MKVLKSIPSNLIASIDVESVRIAEKFEDLSDGYKSAWEYKNKQNGVIPTPEELADLWERTSSLYAEFSKVCAISLTYLNKSGKLVCKEFYGNNEQGILESLAVTLTNMLKHGKYRLVGHASKYFDYPFLGKRYIINGLVIPDALDVTDKKPWEQVNLCTNELWKLGGTGPGSSLQALCNALEIPISKVDLVGDEVGTAFYKEEYARIGRYCSLDTIACFNVVRKFKREPIFQFDEVQYIVAYSDDMTPEEAPVPSTLPVLERIVLSKEIEARDIEEIKSLTKKASKKEKKIIKDIVVSLAIQEQEFLDSGIVQADSQEIKDIKTNQAKEIYDDED